MLGLLPVWVRAAPAEVSAKSAVLMDAATGTVLYEKNAHEALAPASVTKVMTMLLIMEATDYRCAYGAQLPRQRIPSDAGGFAVYAF